MAGAPAAEMRFKNPAILVCDMQEKFRNAIHEFDSIVTTTQKLLAFASSLSIPVHSTTQTAAKLGPTVPSLAALLPSEPHDKTRFSMYIPPIAAALSSPPASSPSATANANANANAAPSRAQVALVGIESHICISQTALDLRDAGHAVYVLADAVSSCNAPEVAVALDRLRAEPGVVVTTSEAWMYECLGDAAHPAFRGLIGAVKASAQDTKRVLHALPPASRM